MPFMPMPFYGGMPFPPPMMGPFQMPKPPQQAANDQNGDNQDGSARPSGAKPGPDQFGASRPPFPGGQWFMPGGPHIFPYGMMPGFSPPSMQPTAAVPQNVAHNPPGPQPIKVYDGATSNPQQPAGNRVSEVDSETNVHGETPISSIRPSGITRNQISLLKKSMKHYEDQLQYNKHQIDERYMETQAQKIRNDIQKFEGVLDSQLSAEAAVYPDEEKVNAAKSKGTSENPQRSARSSMSDAIQEGFGASLRGLRVCQHSSAKKEAKMKSRTGRPTNSGRPAFTGPDYEEAVQLLESERPNSIPQKAALATPFQPRVDGSNEETRGTTDQSSGDSLQQSRNYTTEELRAAREHLLAVGGDTWRVFGHKKPNGTKTSLDLPYLVGRLPHGLDPQKATSHNYVYSRPLKEDELQARHAYWGKPPSVPLENLPFFDGKDFYLSSARDTNQAGQIRPGFKPTTHAGVRTQGETSLEHSRRDIDVFADQGNVVSTAEARGGHGREESAMDSDGGKVRLSGLNRFMY